MFKIVAILNIIIIIIIGSGSINLLTRQKENGLAVAVLLLLFLLWVVCANIGILFSKEWGRRAFLILLWFLVLVLNFFLIFQMAPFFRDAGIQDSRHMAILIYISILLPCGLEILFFTQPELMTFFQRNKSGSDLKS